MEQKSLKDLIVEHLENKGFNFEKAFQATEIPKHYLEAILKGEWQKLPAAPYTKGYFKKLESVLNLESDSLWQLYCDETEVKMSGAADKLPENRYAIKARSLKWTWPAVAVIAVAIYTLLNAGRFLGHPQINITNPLNATVISNLPNFTFNGEIDARDKLFINQEEIYVDKSGKFQEDYKLQPGLNTFEFLAKRFLAGESKVVKQIIYQPSPEPPKSNP